MLHSRKDRTTIRSPLLLTARSLGRGDSAVCPSLSPKFEIRNETVLDPTLVDGSPHTMVRGKAKEQAQVCWPLLYAARPMFLSCRNFPGQVLEN
jgi:hypothetical protein